MEFSPVYSGNKALQYFHSLLDKTEQALLLFFVLFINSEKALTQICVYKPLHPSIMSVYDSWQSKTCASMTAEIFDIDHEGNPSLGLYPWPWQTEFASWLSFSCISGFLVCISICPYFTLGKTGKRVSVNQSLKQLLFYQNNFEYTQCHLKFWVWMPSDVTGASVTPICQ